jgi:carbonic anhydrase
MSAESCCLSKKTDTNECDGCLVHQSPISLGDKGQVVYHTSPLFNAPLNPVSHYAFNKDAKEWELDSDHRHSTPVILINNDQKYRLTQFHFHAPAEHVIHGVRHVLELHLVFESVVAVTRSSGNGCPETTTEKNQGCNILVLALLVKQSQRNRTSRLLRLILATKPFQVPQPRSYWTYNGSLTTPPTTVTIEWIVQKRILSVTTEDLKILQRLSKSARPLQPRNGRIIVDADSHCAQK